MLAHLHSRHEQEMYMLVLTAQLFELDQGYISHLFLYRYKVSFVDPMNYETRGPGLLETPCSRTVRASIKCIRLSSQLFSSVVLLSPIFCCEIDPCSGIKSHDLPPF